MTGEPGQARVGAANSSRRAGASSSQQRPDPRALASAHAFRRWLRGGRSPGACAWGRLGPLLVLVCMPLLVLTRAAASSPPPHTQLRHAWPERRVVSEPPFARCVCCLRVLAAPAAAGSWSGGTPAGCHPPQGLRPRACSPSSSNIAGGPFPQPTPSRTTLPWARRQALRARVRQGHAIVLRAGTRQRFPSWPQPICPAGCSPARPVPCRHQQPGLQG